MLDPWASHGWGPHAVGCTRKRRLSPPPQYAVAHRSLCVSAAGGGGGEGSLAVPRVGAAERGSNSSLAHGSSPKVFRRSAIQPARRVGAQCQHQASSAEAVGGESTRVTCGCRADCTTSARTRHHTAMASQPSASRCRIARVALVARLCRERRLRVPGAERSAYASSSSLGHCAACRVAV